MENVSQDWAIVQTPESESPYCDTPRPGFSYMLIRFNMPLSAIFGYIRYPLDTQEV